jgi:ubiquinone/menaquinone biosynthesis C-methylase UbiE
MKKTIMLQWNKIAKLGFFYRRNFNYNLAPYFTKRGKILDIGSGAGHPDLKKYGEVISCDISIEMLKKNTQKLVNCDASNLPFKPKSFDYVTSFATFHHLPKREGEKFLSEIYRVLKSDGIAYLTYGYLSQKGKIDIKWSNVSRTYYSFDINSVKKMLISSKFSSYELFSGSESKKIVTYSKNKEEFQEHFKNMILILKK